MKDKTIVITGALSGIGLSLTKLCIKKGMKVIAIDKEEKQNLYFDFKENITFVIGDVSKESFWEDLIKKDNLIKDVTCLVNCAAVLDKNDSNIDNLTVTLWNSIFSINVLGVFLSCKNLLPVIRSNLGGAIVNISSVVSLVGSENPQLAYTASKGAIVSFTRELAVNEASNNIRINSVSPGLTITPMTEQFAKGKKERSKGIPLQRWATPNEISKTIFFLLTEDSSYITGSNLVVDGGLTAINASTVFLD